MDEPNQLNPSALNNPETANSVASSSPENNPNVNLVINTAIATPILQKESLTQGLTQLNQATPLPVPLPPEPPVQTPVPLSQTTIMTPPNAPAVPPPTDPSGFYPKGTQVFLHPDHETIKAAALQKPGSGLNLKMLSFLIFGFLLLGVGLSVWFFFLPRSQAVRFANMTHDSIDDTTQKLQVVDKALNSLYSTVNVKESNPVLSNVLGVTTSSDERKTFPDSALFAFENFQNNFSSQGKVKGFNTSSNDPNKTLRDIKDLATTVDKKTKTAQESALAFSKILAGGVPDLANGLKEKLTKLENHTDDYVDESGKTGRYYAFLEDGALEIESIATGTNYDVAISQLSTLKSKFVDYKDLPDGMEKVNQNTIDITDLLIDYLKEDRQTPGAKRRALYSSYSEELKAIGAKNQLDQISFWKNNKTLGSYDDISDEQTHLLRDTKKLKNANNFFLLDWTGIS